MQSEDQKKSAHEYQAGYEALLQALYEPLKQIVINAGKKSADVVLDKIIAGKEINSGYDASQDKYINDMLKAGIIDPLKVTRTALENAVSIAAMLLTTEAAVTDLPEKKDEHNHGEAMPGLGGMGGMM